MFFIANIKNFNGKYFHRKWLYDQYWNKKLSIVKIAKIANINRGSIYYWLKKHNIPRRTNSQANSKELNHEWKGNQATCVSKHQCIARYKEKSKKCPNCNKEKDLVLSFDHSLGEYTRNPNDYKWLCQKCHIQRDKSWKKRKRNELGQFTSIKIVKDIEEVNK